MPKVTITARSKKPTASKSGVTEQEQFNEDEVVQNSGQSSEVEEEHQTSKSRKRSSLAVPEDEDDIEGAGGDYNNNEMQRMLECFGGEIFKARIAKKKRLELYTTNTLKTTNKRVDDIWKGQHTERQKLHDEFSRQVTSMFNQWEGDLDKTKDQEEKLTNLFRQQQKLFQQTRIIQSQRLKTLKQLHDEYIKGLTNLEKCHTDQQTTVQSELKKEMHMLQKKILMDTQQQEVASFKKSLQNMLY